MNDWDRHLGLRMLRSDADGVVAEFDVDARHHQPYGIVHGGVWCSVVETVCSMGAGMDAHRRGCGVVGLENHTSFVRAVRDGRITVTGTPITRGRRVQLWEAVARDAEQRIVATGRVRLLCIESGRPLAGQDLERTVEE
jgi:1,4-dihydroxy-2-naphthoyl-CoA hydrolase